MKKILLILILISIPITIVRSQVLVTVIFGDKLNTPTTEFGLNIGSCLSTLSGFENLETVATATIGSFFTWKFHERFQLQPELYFVFKGGAKHLQPFDIDDPNIVLPTDEMEVSRESKYFSLPILIKAQIFNQFRFIVGPQISYLISNSDYMYYEIHKKQHIVARQKDRSVVNRIDFGLSAGLGYKLGKGEGVNIEAKYYFGLTNTSTDPTQNLKNRIIILQAGIPIKGFSKQQ
jgi:hypothetical protein